MDHKPIRDHRTISRAELAVMGGFRTPWLRAAFDGVDREAFVPERFWGYATDEHGAHLVVDRALDEDAWRREVWNTHRSLITQMNDHLTPDSGPATGDFSSSVSALDIVFEKLNRLDVAAGDRILHIGTASGYDSALLCERVGSALLTTVEYDPSLAAWGAENLRAAGYSPTVLCGDGLDGWAPRAPYDRIIATAAVRHIPVRWRQQAADGAVIVVPFSTLFAGGGLLKLHVRGGDVASGRFVGAASYMWARSHRPKHRMNPGPAQPKEASPIDPEEVFGGGWADRFALGLYVPDVAFSQRGEGEGRQTQLWDEAGTSVAVVRHGEWWRPSTVTPYGPRNLWRELVGAYSAWRHAGQPHLTRFGLTLGDGAADRLWLDEPGRVVRTGGVVSACAQAPLP
ncbi:protein-L-isoaspartate O-methyltransferase [Streptomyces sp. NPDC091272]|uniref:protein-L-isoaspartate O-methyltransferase family protein n=1 Tax=Streptomyces sp. NPDC091272 TaxID=3365981 RepID=UPI0038104332